MTKKSVQKTAIDLQTLAAELRHVAAQLEQGIIEVEGAAIAVGEPLFLKTKRKLKEERAYFTLSFKVPLTGIPAAAEPVAKSTPPIAPGRPQPRQEMPAVGKTMKKEIGRLWKETSDRIRENTRPSATDVTRLRRLVEEYRLYTAPAWAEEWQQCAATMGRCLDAAATGDFATAVALATTINQQTKSCHKLHK
jgi:XXXCH domain-containing protein